MKIKTLLLTLCAFCALGAAAQDIPPSGGITGSVVSREGRYVLVGAKVTLRPEGLVRYTDQSGRFAFEALPQGQYSLGIEMPEFEDAVVNVRVAATVRDVVVPMIQTVSLADTEGAEAVDFDIDGGDDIQYAAASNLSSSKDLFTNIAGYKFSEMRFNARGLQSETVYLNGIEFNDAMTGYSPWSLWTGLNDATRNSESQAGAGATVYGLGGLNGNTNINARASQMRQGWRFSVAGGTNSYLLRLMGTYASGMLDNGWSYAFSASTRQGPGAWVKGVYYNTWGWFGSVEKRFHGGHTLALTAFGTPTQRGVAAAATDEAYTLMGSNYYNPNWGYQDGKVRNSRVRDNHEPVVMLNYSWNDDARGLTLSSALSWRGGRNGYSALDWYHTDDPRPDYYRYMPSYFTDRFDNGMSLDVGNPRYETTKKWLSDDFSTTQIDWDGLIRRNRNGRDPYTVVNGADARTMNRSSYIVEERRTDQNDIQWTGRLQQVLSPRSKMTYGLNYRYNRTEYFKVAKDLLGGDYWVDIDNFAERDATSGSDATGSRDEAQNDLARPNRAVYEGDKFGYDYFAHLHKGSAWAMYNYSTTRLDLYGAAEIGFANFWRQGLVEKGLFPNHVPGESGRRVPQRQDLTSLGDSRHNKFFTYKVKAGGNITLGGAHNIALGVGYDQSAPWFQNAFTSPRTRNEVVGGLTTEKSFALDVTYNVRYSWGRIRAAGYVMLLRDRSKVLNFYDDTWRTFTNFAMSGINQRHMGIELAAQIPIRWGVSFNTAISLGDFVYTSDPRVTQTADNSAFKQLDGDRVYYNGLRVENTPRFAANAGFSYRGPHNWYAGIDFNMYDGIYASMTPLFRTDRAFRNLSSEREGDQAKMDAIMAQEKLPFAFVVNANVGKMWFLKRGQLGFTLEVKNLANNQRIKTWGYEHSRFYIHKTQADASYETFEAKHQYLYGINFYLNAYYRF